MSTAAGTQLWVVACPLACMLAWDIWTAFGATQHGLIPAAVWCSAALWSLQSGQCMLMMSEREVAGVHVWGTIDGNQVCV